MDGRNRQCRDPKPISNSVDRMETGWRDEEATSEAFCVQMTLVARSSNGTRCPNTTQEPPQRPQSPQNSQRTVGTTGCARDSVRHTLLRLYLPPSPQPFLRPKRSLIVMMRWKLPVQPSLAVDPRALAGGLWPGPCQSTPDVCCPRRVLTSPPVL